ncbi:MAG: hypothetical protein JNK89_05955, partial [Saprospiraceae bacterium]|nr:hypothetical protein [Saprospiraceae bacterium]
MRFRLLLCCALMATGMFAQTAPNFFKPVSEATIQLPEKAERRLFPLKYHTFQLDYAGIKSALQTAPQEFSPEAHKGQCALALPLADGSFEAFAIWEIASLEPALAAQVPFIRTFAGQSLRDPRKMVRLSYTLKGFQAMILNPDQGVEYLDRYAERQTEYYLVYNRHDLPASDRPQLPTFWAPDVATLAMDPTVVHPDLPGAGAQSRDPQTDPIKLKVYRYIVSTTGEYGLDHGPSRDEVFSAVTEHTNRVNAILERDIDIRLQLIQASLLVTFTSPGDSPFTGSTVFDWMGQNPGVLESLSIPSTIYDIGHVYARYISGGAIGVAGGLSCANSKARGCSGGTGSYGDGFINVVGQELGHQMGGGHTWNRCGGGNGRAGATAFEPGSGSTIMSYAGACGSDNVQGYSDL